MSDIVQVDRDKLEKQLSYLAERINSEVHGQRKYLLGRVLTIVDAVANDPEQRKATKDLVHDLFYQGSYWNEIRNEFEQLQAANGISKPMENMLPGDAEPANQYSKF